ncbi:MAG TPA: single-stranded DNA-binding protein [Actinophytocola sp.]|uniref:single-stranded DNA-binding protein n=1 Tax=Actinophytocola sp. TaxID=1872138 RepID=UPI002DDD7830|nr:single-stranded DNA-binding protein [Actinophytocola sp.]HEV2780483.1 single-stranded DNA-binding protein [Actinophytocola sp.]
MFETWITVVGRVITDVTQRTTSSGDKVCNFRMVARERRFHKESQEWVDGDKLFIQVKCWRRLAEGVSASLFKGDPVVVFGRVYLNEYEINGETRSAVELEARAIGPDLSMCTAMIQRSNRDIAASDTPMTVGATAA